MTRPPPDDYADSEAQTLVYSAPRLNLCGTVGPLRGRVYTSDGNTVLIGRGEACTIVLLVAGISRQHARIDYRSGHYWVADLGTLNGTFVNGKLLDHPRQLDEGDRILICNQEFMVRFGEMDRDELLKRREGSVARPITSPGPHTQRGAMPTSSPEEGTVKVQMPVAEPQPVGRPNSRPPGQRPASQPPLSRPLTRPPSQPPLSRPLTRPPSQPPTTRSISQPGISRPITEDSLPRAITQTPSSRTPSGFGSNTPSSRPITLPPVVHSPTPSPFRRTQPPVRFTAASRKLPFQLTPQARRIVLIAGVALGVILLSVFASIIAVRWFAPAPKVVTVPTVAPIEAPKQTGPIVTPVVPQQPLPATLEADGLAHLTSNLDGVVRRAVIEGTSVRSGQPLVETGQASPDVERKRAKLAELEAKYGHSPDYADFIAQARDEYEKAARKSSRSVLAAPHAGIVTRQRVRVGDTIHRGDDVIEMATRVHLIVATGSVEGNAAACKATLLDRQDSVILGHMLPFPPAARVRTLLVDRLPPGLPLGAVGKVRVTCQ